MANGTPQALTEQHRQAQLAIRAQALRDFSALWPIWTGDEASFTRFVAAIVTLVSAYRPLSAAAANAYYEAFRQLEGVAGVATPSLLTVIPDAQIVTSMYVTVRDALREALNGGQIAEHAKSAALVRASGAASRHVLAAGRQTIIDSVQADPQAVGWARVTDGDPCYFCLTLASRGPVYKTEQTADFQAHDHCACTAMPVYKGTDIPGLSRWRDIYNAAQSQGEASGLLQPGENSSAARLRAVRHYLAAQ